MTRELSTQNVVKIRRRVDIKNFFIGSLYSVGFIKTFDVAVNFAVCLFYGLKIVLKKPDRKLALDGSPHTLNAALCLRRPRQDLMYMKLLADALPLGSFFMHNLELFPGSKLRALWSVAKDSSTIRINLTRNAIGKTGLPQDLKVPVEALVLCKIKPGDFTGSVINAARQTIAFIVAELIKPGKRSTVNLHKIALAIPTQTRTMHFFFLFDFMSLGRDQPVVLHDFS